MSIPRFYYCTVAGIITATLVAFLFGASGSLWWGVIGVLYFKSVSFVSPLELTIHRTVWTAFLLIFSISIYSKWNDVYKILKDYKTTLLLIITSILIVGNWYTWIYAVTINKLIDAAFGYYIFPISWRTRITLCCFIISIYRTVWRWWCII